MKTLIVSVSLLLGFFLISPMQGNAQCEASSDNKKDKKAVAEVASGDLEKTSFAVQGNCSMCEARIEKAAKSVEGVKKASWNVEKDMLTIHYMKEKVSLADVHKKIAEAGHDTSEKEAMEENYASLPGCCKYRDEN